MRELQRKIMRLLKEKIACYSEVRVGHSVMDVIIVTPHYCLHTILPSQLPHTSIWCVLALGRNVKCSFPVWFLLWFIYTEGSEYQVSSRARESHSQWTTKCHLVVREGGSCSRVFTEHIQTPDTSHWVARGQGDRQWVTLGRGRRRRCYKIL